MRKGLKVEIINLDEENLKDTPEWDSHPFSCKYCIYWEFPEECIDPAKERKEEMIKKKIDWLQNTKRVFGNCGKILYVNGKSVGYAQFAPAGLLPNSAEYPAGPPSNDAVLISCLFVWPKKFRRKGLGSKFLINIVDELRRNGIRAVETFARKGKPENPSGPMEFYLKNGFKIYLDDPEFPLMRLDLTT